MKTVKVEFIEQSKGVTAQTKVEVIGEEVNYDEVLKEADELFAKAFIKSQNYARRK